MKNKKNTAEYRRREAVKRRIFEEEGFTPQEIERLPKKVRRAILEKYRA